MTPEWAFADQTPFIFLRVICLDVHHCLVGNDEEPALKSCCADFTQHHPLPPRAQGIHVGFGPSLAHANTLWQAKERITEDSRNLVASGIRKGSEGV